MHPSEEPKKFEDSPSSRRSFEWSIASRRVDAKQCMDDVLALTVHEYLVGDHLFDGYDKEEVIANIMLAYRHFEDGRMRLGKVFEAIEGKTSSTR